MAKKFLANWNVKKTVLLQLNDLECLYCLVYIKYAIIIVGKSANAMPA